MEGGEDARNSKGGYTAESFSKLPSPSIRDRVKVLVDISFAGGISPFAEGKDPNLCLLLINQCANSPLRVSLAKLSYIFNTGSYTWFPTITREYKTTRIRAHQGCACLLIYHHNKKKSYHSSKKSDPST